MLLYVNNSYDESSVCARHCSKEFYVLTALILTLLHELAYCYLYFILEETESEKVKMVAPNFPASK
jgi:hypothetical protein